MDARRTQTSSTGLFADLYELTMLSAYGANGMNGAATFSLFVRQLPNNRNFLVACGVDDLVGELEALRFGEADIAYLRSLGMLSERDLSDLSVFRFTCDVRAVDGPIPQAQLIETLVLNQVGLQTLLAPRRLASSLPPLAARSSTSALGAPKASTPRCRRARVSGRRRGGNVAAGGRRALRSSRHGDHGA